MNTNILVHESEELTKETFQKLTLEEKRVIVGREIAETNFILENILKTIKPNTELTSNTEYDKLMNITLNESDYYDNLYEGILNLEDSIADVVEVVSKPFLEGEE